MPARSLLAGCLYFTVVFAIGFMVGTLRVLVVEPRLGDVASVALELPLMLAASFAVARAIVVRMKIEAAWPSRLAMGVSGMVLLVAAELLLGLAFGQSLAGELAAYGTPRGLLTALGQVGFALMPLLVRRPR